MRTEISIEELKAIIPDKGEMIGDFIFGISLVLLAFSVFSGTASLKWGFLIIGCMCIMRAIDKIGLSNKIKKILKENPLRFW